MRLNIALCGVAFAGYAAVLSSPAIAMCDLPAEVRQSTRAAARYLLENADFVGIVEVVSQGRGDGNVPEVLDVLIRYKGDGDRFYMRRALEGPNIVVTNASVTLGMPAGAIGFVALHRAPHGMVISECTSALYEFHRPAALIRELSRLRPSSSH